MPSRQVQSGRAAGEFARWRLRGVESDFDAAHLRSRATFSRHATFFAREPSTTQATAGLRPRMRRVDDK